MPTIKRFEDIRAWQTARDRSQNRQSSFVHRPSSS